MVAAIKQTVTVQAGGLVEVRSPSLPEGARAEVIVLLEDEATAPPPEPARPLNWGDFVGSGRGRFASAEEADAYVRGLRDEWDH
jgi:hypothetical protein